MKDTELIKGQVPFDGFYFIRSEWAQFFGSAVRAQFSLISFRGT